MICPIVLKRMHVTPQGDSAVRSTRSLDERTVHTENGDGDEGGVVEHDNWAPVMLVLFSADDDATTMPSQVMPLLVAFPASPS